MIFLVPRLVKNLLALQETQILFLGRDNALEKEMASHSSILAWRAPWTEEPGRLQFMGLERVRYDWETNFQLSLFKLPDLTNQAWKQYSKVNTKEEVTGLVVTCTMLLLNCSVTSDSFQPHELQHTRLPCPSPSPRACSNSCPLSRRCHPNISSSVVCFPTAFNLAQHQSIF